MKGNTFLIIGIAVVALILGIFLLGGRRRAADSTNTNTDGSAAGMGGSSLMLGNNTPFARPGESFSSYLERQRQNGWGLNVNMLN